MDAHDCDDDAQRKVERDEESVQAAAGSSEEAVKQACERDSEGVHGCCGTDEDPLPKVGR